MLAVYRLMDELRRRHAGLEIESCSSGGARVDLGVLAHTQRVWGSDCIDALERQSIHRWTQLLLPPELIGAHVGAAYAHTTGRHHDLGFRAGTALFGLIYQTWSPRAAFFTGDLNVHDLAYDQSGALWFVNTRFSCLATLDRDHNFVPRWRPKFVTALEPSDRCHLNGLCIVDQRVRFVTALAETDTPAGWREHKGKGGLLIDVASGEFVARGLSMPHSPRWHDGRMWVLESGKGALSTIDLATGKVETVVELPGFTRAVHVRTPAESSGNESRYATCAVGATSQMSARATPATGILSRISRTGSDVATNKSMESPSARKRAVCTISESGRFTPRLSNRTGCDSFTDATIARSAFGFESAWTTLQLLVRFVKFLRKDGRICPSFLFILQAPRRNSAVLYSARGKVTMELQAFEEFLERKGQLTRIQVNLLKSDLELLSKYAAFVTQTKGSRLTVADLCQLAIRDYVTRHNKELSDRMGNFEYAPRQRKGKKGIAYESIKTSK